MCAWFANLLANGDGGAINGGPRDAVRLPIRCGSQREKEQDLAKTAAKSTSQSKFCCVSVSFLATLSVRFSLAANVDPCFGFYWVCTR